MNKLREKSMGCVFLVTALASIFAVIIICLFLFANGLPTIAEIGPFDFLLGTTWKPTNDIYGIFPMILGSIYVTAGSLIIGVPVGLLCADLSGPVLPAHVSISTSSRQWICWRAFPPSSTASSAWW